MRQEKWSWALVEWRPQILKLIIFVWPSYKQIVSHELYRPADIVGNLGFVRPSGCNAWNCNHNS